MRGGRASGKAGDFPLAEENRNDVLVKDFLFFVLFFIGLSSFFVNGLCHYI